MKAKRLTALALAALMAASTTSVALASEKVEYDLDFKQDGYYRYDEDEGRIVKADPDYTFAPGEKIYVRVEENTQGTKFPNKKSYDAYAEWKLGGSWIKDINLVYKKGNITTPGAATTEYYIKGLSGTLTALNGTKLDANTLDSLKAKVEASNEYKTMVETELNTKYKKSAYQVTGTGDKYATEKEAAEKSIEKAINGGTVTEESSYKTVDGKQYKNNGLPTNIVSANNSGYVSAGKFYDDGNLATALSDNGWHLYDAAYEGQQKLYYGTGDESKSNGAIDAGNTSGTAVSNSDNIYVDKAPNASAAKFIKLTIDKSEVAAATGDAVKAATNEYYNKQDNNKIVTVLDVNTTGYFRGDEFLGSTKEEAGKKNRGYQEVQNVWYDDNGFSTEENARAAAKASVDRTLQLSVANNIEPKPVTGPSSATAQYEYWVEISTKSSNSTKENDLVGTLYTGTNKNSAKNGDSFRLEVTLSNQSNNSGNKNDYKDATDHVTIKDGERAIVSFADDASDEFEVEFGDDARFVFNARGQSKLNLAYNTKYNKDFAYDYDDANIDFLTFEGEPTTNRTGTLYIYADEDSYIYEVTSKGAKKINGAYYDDDEGAWVIRTRNLTSYAISDKKLKTVNQTNNSSSSNSSNKPDSSNNKPGSSNNKPGNGKPNPDTGR